MEKTKTSAAVALCVLVAVAFGGTAHATPVQITIENLAPQGGVYLTPVWVGFHNGSFDSYDGGSAAAPALERLAEDGNTVPISDVFGAGGTLVPTAGTASAGRQQGALGGGPIAPSTSVSGVFDLDLGGDNQFFSYASMVLVSNDYFVANGNPLAHDLSILLSQNSFTFDIGLSGTVNDAGTEINDFETSAGNGLFPGLAGGQGGPNVGADENGVITNVANPFAGFLNPTDGFDLGPQNFNDYPSGIARVSFSVVPEPSTVLLLGIGVVGLATRRKRSRSR